MKNITINICILLCFLIGIQHCTAQLAPGMVGVMTRSVTPAVTYATYNATYKGSTVTLPAVTVASITPTNGVACATIGASTTGKSSGKWYWEITNTFRGGNSSIGVTNSVTLINLNTFMGADTHGWAYYSNGGGTGGTWSAGVLTLPNWTDYVQGDVIGVALDADANTVTFYKYHLGVTTNQGTLSISGGNYFPANSANVGTFTANYGQSAFVMTVPSGYNAGYY